LEIAATLSQRLSSFGNYDIYIMEDNEKDILIYKTGRVEINKVGISLKFRINGYQVEKFNDYFKTNNFDSGIHEFFYDYKIESVDEISKILNCLI
jgi:hypothetical protein